MIPEVEGLEEVVSFVEWIEPIERGNNDRYTPKAKAALKFIENLLDAFDSVTWYNGLAGIILQWKNDDFFVNNDETLGYKFDVYESYEDDTKYQIQVIWMICVSLFGDYGTSPRFGWIYKENKDAFHDFIDAITQTHRYDLEQSKEGDSVED